MQPRRRTHYGDLPSTGHSEGGARGWPAARVPNDVAFRTTATGIEFARTPIPCRAERYILSPCAIPFVLLLRRAASEANSDDAMVME